MPCAAISTRRPAILARRIAPPHPSGGTLRIMCWGGWNQWPLKLSTPCRGDGSVLLATCTSGVAARRCAASQPAVACASDGSVARACATPSRCGETFGEKHGDESTVAVDGRKLLGTVDCTSRAKQPCGSFVTSFTAAFQIASPMGETPRGRSIATACADLGGVQAEQLGKSGEGATATAGTALASRCTECRSAACESRASGETGRSGI